MVETIAIAKVDQQSATSTVTAVADTAVLL